jgi:hypothetical protein
MKSQSPAYWEQTADSVYYSKLFDKRWQRYQSSIQFCVVDSRIRDALCIVCIVGVAVEVRREQIVEQKPIAQTWITGYYNKPCTRNRDMREHFIYNAHIVQIRAYSRI